MPKNSKKKEKTSVTLDPEIVAWLDEQVKEKRFGSRSHGIELCVKAIKTKMEKGEKVDLK